MMREREERKNRGNRKKDRRGDKLMKMLIKIIR